MGFECVACLVSVAKATLPLRQAPVSHAMFIRLATNKALEKHIVFPDHKTGQILPCSRVGAAMDGFANILLALQEDASEQPQVSVSGSNSYWYPDGK
jgi:hypothetical protein